MIEFFKTGIWFVQRPSFWPHACSLFIRRFSRRRDTAVEQIAAHEWATSHAVAVGTALEKVGLCSSDQFPSLPLVLLKEARSCALSSTVKMGGPGDINLLYAAVLLSGAERLVETGVAYGWSSFAVLAAVKQQGRGTLVSVDMPYPKLNNEAWVGIAVPEWLRTPWVLIREPDRFGLRKAIAYFDGTIDLCHYDSDKSYAGRRYGYGLLWKALRRGGIFISDDIQDNLAFRDFIGLVNVPFAVTEYEGKFVGIARKE
jgi:predicted O-methyltransferase YrrM